MWYASLTRAQRALYHETTAGTHHREVELVLRRRNDSKPVASLTNRFLGGSVQGDSSRLPATVLECDVFDDDHALDWAHGAHRRFDVQIIDSRFVPELDDWVSQIVFTGPLWDFDRRGDVVSLVAEGPEMNALGSVRLPYNKPAKTRAHVPIRQLLRAAGARSVDLSIPAMRATLPRDVTVGVKRGKKDKDRKKKGPKRRALRVNREDTYWGAVEPIAEASNRDLFGDGRGRFLMRREVRRSQFSFTNRMLLSPVKENRGDDSEITNTWIVLGANPKGPKKRVKAVVRLPRRHPASAWTLRWNDTPREVTEVIENDQIRSVKRAREIGERRRNRALREQVEHEVEALPVIPWLRPDTMVSVPTKGGRASTRVRRWTLPLGPGPDPLVIGANRARRWSR